MRYFNPKTMTEAIPVLHDITVAIALSDDHWFFASSEIPKGMLLSVSDDGEPILVEAIDNSDEE